MSAPESGASKVRIVLAFLAIYVVWGSTYLAIRYAVETLPPLLMAGSRFIVAGGMLFAWRRLRGDAAPSREHWKNTGIIGTLLLLGGNGLVCWAEQYVASGLAALIICAVPLYMAAMEWLIFRGPRPGVRIVTGLLLGIAGVVILIGPGTSESGTTHVGGAIALLCASASWSFGSLLSRKISMPRSAMLATGMEMIVGGIALMIAGTLRGEWADLDIERVSMASLAGVGYLIVMGSLIGFSAYVWLLTVVSPAIVSTYAFVNPCVAVLLGVLIGGEHFDRRILFAAILIIGAVVLITLRAGKKSQVREASVAMNSLGFGGSQKTSSAIQSPRE